MVSSVNYVKFQQGDTEIHKILYMIDAKIPTFNILLIPINFFKNHQKGIGWNALAYISSSLYVSFLFFSFVIKYFK